MPSEDSLAEPVSTAHFTGQQGPLPPSLRQCQGQILGIWVPSPDSWA